MHPSDADLEKLVEGRLNLTRVDQIVAHLDECTPCQDVVARLEAGGRNWVNGLRGPVRNESVENEAVCIELIDVVAEMGRDPTFISNPASSTDDNLDELQELGQYKLLNKLGQGGMGAVYKAMHTRLEKVVAVKVLPSGRLANDAAISRFHREMKAVGKLNHPNIIAAHDAGDVDGMHFLVMEIVDGDDFSAICRRRGPLRVPDACEVIRQAAEGLQHASDHGLVHRDIKPSNLMLNADGRVKILDMGLALLENPLGGEDGLTSTGQMMGTVDYMAPEQVTDSHSVDIRADIYSLGCTLYRLLSDAAPFDAVTGAFNKATAHVTSPVPPLTDRRSDVPRELLDILDRMLAKSPDKRFQKPADLAAALEPFARGHDLAGLLAESLQHEQTTTGSESPTLSVASGITETKNSQPSPIAEVARTFGQPRSKRLLIVGVIGLVASLSAIALLIAPPSTRETVDEPILTAPADPSPELPGNQTIDLASGLVGHWNFEEGKGTWVADVSGQNKHGTLENTDDSIWSREGPPSPHAAKASLILDGVNDHFTVPSATMLNGSEGMTVSIWLKPHTPRVFVELGSATRNAFGLLADGRFYVSTEENRRIDVVPDLSLPTGQWHHLAGRYDGQLMTVFRNGQPVASEKHSGHIVQGNESQIVYRFGGLPTTNRFFKGSIADIRIYDRALTDYEIAVLAGASTANAEEPSRTSVTPAVSQDRQPNAESSRIELNRGLVGHWNFEEGEGPQASDSSGNENHGTLTNMDSSAWIKDAPPTRFAGQSSLRFDGVDDYVLIPDAPSLNPEREITIAFWRKIDADTELETPFFSKRLPDQCAQYAYSTVGRLEAGWQPRSKRMTNLNRNFQTRDGHWHHESVIIDEDTLRIYVDGSELLHGTTDVAGLEPCDAPLTLGFGQMIYHNKKVGYFQGQLDDVRIYNRVLSHEEIAALAGVATPSQSPQKQAP